MFYISNFSTIASSPSDIISSPISSHGLLKLARILRHCDCEAEVEIQGLELSLVAYATAHG